MDCPGRNVGQRRVYCGRTGLRCVPSASRFVSLRTLQSRPIRPVPFELPRAASRAGDCLERQDVDGGKRLASASCQPRRFETLDPWEEGTRTGR